MTPLPTNQSSNSQANRSRSISVLRCIGYGLLVLALFDLITTIVPMHLMNPAWEFQTIGALVERVPVPLLGLGLVFYGEASFRRSGELIFLNLLSWLCLLFGILFLLLIPLGVNNTVRLNAQNKAQITAQYNQQLVRVEQLEKQLHNAKTEDIEDFIQRQGKSLSSKDPQQVKKQLLSHFTSAKQNLQTQYQAKYAEQRLTLLKNSAKWNLGALVCGMLFIFIWRLTSWAR